MKYEQDIHQFLSIYRFLSFGIAVVLTQVMPLRTGEGPAAQTYLVLTILGIYTLLKVFPHIRWWQKDPVTYVVLFGDLAVCILLVLFTGGLNSGFLLYSFIPIITASLLFNERVSITTAGVSALSLLGAHLGLSQFSDKFIWLMEDNYLPLLIVYVISCFLIATLTYRSNLNIQARIQRDAILGERRRIKQEMHDGVAQVLSYLNMKTKLLKDLVSSHNTDQALRELGDIRDIVQDTYMNIRDSIDQLSAEEVSVQLVPALSNYVKDFSARCKIPVQFDAPSGLLQISPVAELQLLRITQEVLANVRKHSRATQVLLKLENDRHQVRLMVKDNGQGLPQGWQEYQKEKRGYHGLVIMKERAESLGGTLEIVTNPGEGTEIRVCAPTDRRRM